MSFYCEHCGNRNSEVQFGGKIKEQAVVCTLTLNEAKVLFLPYRFGQDLNREIIKSEHAVISIPELEFEIPSNKKGSVNTIEGLLQNW